MSTKLLLGWSRLEHPDGTHFSSTLDKDGLTHNLSFPGTRKHPKHFWMPVKACDGDLMGYFRKLLKSKLAEGFKPVQTFVYVDLEKDDAKRFIDHQHQVMMTWPDFASLHEVGAHAILSDVQAVLLLIYTAAKLDHAVHSMNSDGLCRALPFDVGKFVRSNRKQMSPSQISSFGNEAFVGPLTVTIRGGEQTTRALF